MSLLHSSYRYTVIFSMITYALPFWLCFLSVPLMGWLQPSFVPAQIWNGIWRVLFAIPGIFLLGKITGQNGFAFCFRLRSWQRALVPSVPILLLVLVQPWHYLLLPQLSTFPAFVRDLSVYYVFNVIFEEVLFRGLLLTAPMLRWGNTPLRRLCIVFAAALFFAGGHVDALVHYGSMLCFAFAMSGAYLYTGNLLVPMILHFMQGVAVQLFREAGTYSGETYTFAQFNLAGLIFCMLIPLAFGIYFTVKADDFAERILPANGQRLETDTAASRAEAGVLLALTVADFSQTFWPMLLQMLPDALPENLLNGIYALLVFALLCPVFHKLTGRSVPHTFFGVKNWRLSLLAALPVLLFLLTQSNQWWLLPNVSHLLPQLPGILFYSVTVTLLEELVFRGLFLTLLRPMGRSPSKRILLALLAALASVVFTYAALSTLVSEFMFALCAASIYLCTGSLLVPLLLHIAWIWCRTTLPLLAVYAGQSLNWSFLTVNNAWMICLLAPVIALVVCGKGKNGNPSKDSPLKFDL